jgi:STE24 endopeptidase
MNEDKATRYHRLKRRAAVLSFVSSGVLLAALVATGASAGLRDGAALAGPLAVVLYVIELAFAVELVTLPLSFYSEFVLERRYGLSGQRLGAWLRDEAKSLAVTIVVGAGAASLVYALIGRWPTSWWVPAGAAAALVTAGLTKLAPVVLLPLFYRMAPLDREPLGRRLVALAERAGAQVVGAYEWRLGEKTTRANAALAGLGATRRILVSDTMLAAYSDEEIEIVLAHELAHHVHGDIWKSVILESGLMFAGLFAAAAALEQSVAWLGLSGPADLAGLPVLLLAVGAVSLVGRPALQAISRAHERNADRFALELTRNPDAFVSAMRRLAAQNLAEERPSKIIEWLFYSHPPMRERILAAQASKVKSRVGPPDASVARTAPIR